MSWLTMNQPHRQVDSGRNGRTVWVRYDLRIDSEPNARGHWATKARRVKRHRSTAAGVLAVHLPQPTLPCVVKLIRIAPRALDGDNLQGAFKATRDGVADRLRIADNDPRVTWEYAQERGAAKYYAVRIEVTS